MKTDSTQWSKLSAQIDKIKSKAKQSLKKYEKKKFNSLYNKKRSLDNENSIYNSSPIKLGYSMNLIRDRIHHQQQTTQLIKTRINYLRVQRDRKMQSSERARKKLHTVLTIRSQNSLDKEFINKELNTLHQQSMKAKKQLNERTRSQKQRIYHQRQRRFSQNSIKARQTKVQRVENEEIISKRNYWEKVKNQNAVKQVKKQQQLFMKNKIRRERQIINSGKLNHRNKIQRQYLNLKITKKINQKAMNYFNRQSHRILEETARAQQNLQQFEYMLMHNSKKNYNFKHASQKQSPVSKSTVKSTPKVKQELQKNTKNNFFHLTN